MARERCDKQAQKKHVSFTISFHLQMPFEAFQVHGHDTHFNVNSLRESDFCNIGWYKGAKENVEAFVALRI